MNRYFMTEDGRIFDDRDEAAIHDSALQFSLYGEFGHCGYILESDDRESFTYFDHTPVSFYKEV